MSRKKTDRRKTGPTPKRAKPTPPSSYDASWGLADELFTTEVGLLRFLTSADPARDYAFLRADFEAHVHRLYTEGPKPDGDECTIESQHNLAGSVFRIYGDACDIPKPWRNDDHSYSPENWPTDTVDRLIADRNEDLDHRVSDLVSGWNPDDLLRPESR